jgi:hypothetical protein
MMIAHAQEFILVHTDDHNRRRGGSQSPEQQTLRPWARSSSRRADHPTRGRSAAQLKRPSPLRPRPSGLGLRDDGRFGMNPGGINSRPALRGHFSTGLDTPDHVSALSGRAACAPDDRAAVRGPVGRCGRRPRDVETNRVLSPDTRNQPGNWRLPGCLVLGAVQDHLAVW